MSFGCRGNKFLFALDAPKDPTKTQLSPAQSQPYMLDNECCLMMIITFACYHSSHGFLCCTRLSQATPSSSNNIHRGKEDLPYFHRRHSLESSFLLLLGPFHGYIAFKVCSSLQLEIVRTRSRRNTAFGIIGTLVLTSFC